MEDRNKVFKIDLVGVDSSLFANLKEKLISMVNKVLDASVDVNTGLTVREELQKFSSLGIQYAEAKLKKASIDNDRTISQIAESYSLIEKNKAESRMINATAKALEFEQSLKELSFTLKMTKALIIGNQGEEAIVFTKQIDVFLDVINSLSETNKQ